MSGTRLATLAADLARWDEADREALLVGVFEDERPLRGAAGLCDWRLGGRLSRLLRRDRLRGVAGESLLMPPGRRLRFRRLVLFGLGASGGYDEARCRADARRMRQVAADAGIVDYAVELPGRALERLPARRAVELWLDEAARDGRRPDATSFVDGTAGLKEIAEVLRKRYEQGRTGR